ncbi:MAG: hypothetical protein LBQ52_03905 [Helicobacteraceae bacterium]|nr:hypothetical protein [Helicobacteraceae bacterium]
MSLSVDGTGDIVPSITKFEEIFGAINGRTDAISYRINGEVYISSGLNYQNALEQRGFLCSGDRITHNFTLSCEREGSTYSYSVSLYTGDSLFFAYGGSPDTYYEWRIVRK